MSTETHRYRTIVAAWDAYVGDRELTYEDMAGAQAAVAAVLPDVTVPEVSAALRWRASELEKEAEFQVRIVRLAQATGCPEGTPVLPWLVKRGLMRRDGITAPLGYAFTDKAKVQVAPWPSATRKTLAGASLRPTAAGTTSASGFADARQQNNHPRARRHTRAAEGGAMSDSIIPRPEPEVLAARARRALGQSSRQVIKPVIYFAGKISKNGWRESIAGYRAGGLLDGCEDDERSLFDPRYRVECDAFFYGGPFFASCDHGCDHRPAQHASGSCAYAGEDASDRGLYPKILAVNSERIRRADLMFTFIDEVDCFGTLIELGIALRQPKPTVRAVGFGPRLQPQQRKEQWMAEHCATRVYAGPLAAMWHEFATEFLPLYRPSPRPAPLEGGG
jgi:hypothetical protein